MRYSTIYGMTVPFEIRLHTVLKCRLTVRHFSLIKPVFKGTNIKAKG